MLQGDRLAYRFLVSGDCDGEKEEWTYATLDFRARAIGSALQEAGAQGERVLLLYPPGLEFIAAFMGCLYAGAIAVPTYPPDPARLERTLPRLQAIVEDSGARFVLTTTPILEMAEFLLPQAPLLKGLCWMASDNPSEEKAVAWTQPEVGSETLAFLQYTSGSTGLPKGVMVSHGNVLHNERQIQLGFGHDPEVDLHIVGWLPLFHDMGLIGNVLQPLYLGVSCTLLSPLAFLQRPLRWMEAISRFRAHTSGGPNFAYDLCARRVTSAELANLDLSSWKVAFNGAEPIRKETLDRFAHAFAPAGFQGEAVFPCYGLAEATLFVTGAAKGDPPTCRTFDGAKLERAEVAEVAEHAREARTLVSSGHCAAEQRILIVDPQTCQLCPPNRIGEIWVSGANVAYGYWERPTETERTFQAHLADSGEGPFLRTGDLGFLQEGELYVTGRLKDLIILRGRNLYPQDIEQAVERVHPRIRPGCCAAFSLEVEEEERLAVAAEVEPRGEVMDMAALVMAIRRAVAEEYGAHVHAVLLLKPRSIPKTTSGKIQRHACRLGFLEGTLEVVERSVAVAEAEDTAPDGNVPLREALLAAVPEVRLTLVERFLQAEVARVLRVAPSRVERSASPASLGLDSLLLLEVQARLESALGLTLPSAFVWQHPTVARLAEGLLEVWEETCQGSRPRALAPVPAPLDGALPLSPGQLRLWFLDKLMPESAAYNIQFGVRLTGALDVAALERGLAWLVERHATLRTVFREVEGQPRQFIQLGDTLELPRVDLSGLPQGAREPELRRLAGEIGRKPFALDTGPLVRTHLVALGREEHVLLLTLHHIITDGWSIEVMTGELAAIYRSLTTGAPLGLSSLPLAYADYARWEIARSASLDEQRAFWKQELAGLPRLELPADYLTSGSLSSRGTSFSLAVPREVGEELKSLGRQESCTPFMVLLAAYATLLHRYSGQEDFAVGSVVANRERNEFREVLGFFANTVVMRCNFSGKPTFLEVLRRVRAAATRALSHADLPFDEVVEVTQAARNGNRNPLFQAGFVLEKLPARHTEVPGMVWTPLLWAPDGAVEGTAKFEISLSMVEGPEGFTGAIEYSTDLFEPTTIEWMAGHLQLLLRGVVSDPARPVAELPILTEVERHRLLVDWNDTAAEFPREACLPELFEAQVERTPDAIAAVFREQRLSYRELNRRANRLAGHLRASGVGPDVIVAVLMERSLDFLTTLLAIFKAGGAYLPLEPAHPAQRQQQVLAQSGVAHVVASSAFVPLLSANSLDKAPRVLRFEELLSQEGSEDNPRCRGSADRLAYVIYTSGSTGLPKGAMVIQRGMINHLCAKIRDMRLAGTDAVAQTASQCFDISVWQLFAALLVGGRVHIYPNDLVSEPQRLFEQVRADGVSILELVPSFLRMALESLLGRDPAPLPLLRWLMLTGEALPPRLCRAWLKLYPDIPLINAYGPTECSDDVTHHPIRVPPGPEVLHTPIGRPIQNTRLYILDRGLQPVPVGVAGELCVGGDGVGRGYLKDPIRTSAVFLPDPFSSAPGARMYRTGDLARYLPNGDIEFLGRLDHQVKVRGFRIELGEIETTLGAHPLVREAVVLAREVNGDKRLVAYVVLREPLTQGTAELRGYLKQRLPEYMVPLAFVVLETLPLNANGKLDRNALPAPETLTPQQGSLVAPRTPVEQLVAGLWGEVLGVRHVGVHDDFFSLGGHSLLATQLVSRIRSSLGVELPLRTLFEVPTLEGLAALIEDARRTEPRRPLPPITKSPREGRLPLSFAQQRLWFLDQLQPGSTFYNVPGAVRVKGVLDVEVLRASLEAIVRRHEALRMCFPKVQGEPRAVISEEAQVPLSVVDLRSLDAARHEEAVRRLSMQEAQRPFDLAKGPLMRVVVLQLAPETHVLLLTMHHIVSDGWSVGVLMDELSRLYEAFSAGLANPLPELPIQYVDYTAWQQRWLQGELLQEQLEYWKRQLAGVPPALELPTDRSRPTVQGFRGAAQPVQLSRELADALVALGRRENSTLFMTLLAAFQTLLYRYTQQESFVVGSPIAGRTREESEGLIGFFVNTLVLRADLGGAPAFREVLGRVREVTLGAYAHQDVPFEKLVEVLQPERDLSRTPLFQVMFVLQNAPRRALRLGGALLDVMEVESGATKFDLTLSLEETPEGLAGRLEYDSDLFDGATVTRMVGHFRMLLEGVVADPDCAIQELPLLTEEEKRQLLVEWNATREDIPVACIHEGVAAQAARAPNATAVIFDSERLSYQELEHRANQLAHHLRRLGVGPEVPVGLCMERSVEMVVGLLGILKAGGAYVPMEPSYPREWLAFLLKDTRPPVLLTQHRLLDTLPEYSGHVLCLDTRWAAIAAEPTGPMANVVTPDNLAYIMYTSGSTGQPKGVQISHRAVGNFLLWSNRVFPLGADDRVMQKTPSSFDASVWEFWAPLLAGAQLVMARPGGHRDVDYLVQALEVHGVTTLKLVPSLLQALLEHPAFGKQPALKQVFCGAEALPGELVRRFHERSTASLCNMYGPTEASIDASYFPCSRDVDTKIVPIGRPIGNVQLHVLDARLQPTPIGVPGELYIGGVGLSRGYWNRAELTAERFIASPFAQEPGARLYRTGDRVRWLPDKNLEFLGRTDHQVKIRGFRIEPGEVESVLGRHPTVREVLVMAREDRPGDKRLVAYVTGREGSTPDTGELHHYLRGRLPEHLCPSSIVVLPAMPLTPSGKIDRRALPTPGSTSLQGAGVGPRSLLELRLVEIWEEVLGTSPIGVTDDFFKLGGHSLLAVRLLAQVRARLGVELPLVSLFRGSTIEQMASLLRQPTDAMTDSPLVCIQPEGNDSPLFLVHPVGGHVLCYVELVRALGRGRPIYALQSSSSEASSARPRSLEEMATHYLKAIRRIQPQGPYCLGGWSMGGVVCLEMARQLEQHGEHTALLALIDSQPPERSRTARSRHDLPLVKWFALDFAASYGHDLSSLTSEFGGLGPSEQTHHLLDRFKQLGLLPREFSLKELEALMTGFERNLAALERYTPHRIAQRITLLRAEQQPEGEEGPPTLGWESWTTGGVSPHVLSGNHYTLLREPYVRELARRLMLCLEKGNEEPV